MWPEHWLLGVLHATGELFWLDQCESVAREMPGQQTGRYAKVPFIEEPTALDYERALTTGMADSLHRKVYIRTRLWWGANDAHRTRSGTVPSVPLHTVHANLRALLPLLDPAEPEQRLMAAEAHRERGEFTEAAKLLHHNFPEEYADAARFLRELIAQEDTLVCEIPPSS